jgi:excisionase family DNA binding protein
LSANNETRRKIFMPMDESSIAIPGHDGVAESSTINPGDMAESRTGHDEILTVGQVSKLLKLHQRTIYKLVRNGTIPGRRVGKSWRFLKSEIVKWFEKKDV